MYSITNSHQQQLTESVCRRKNRTYWWQQQMVQVAEIGLEVAWAPDHTKENFALAAMCIAEGLEKGAIKPPCPEAHVCVKIGKTAKLWLYKTTHQWEAGLEQQAARRLVWHEESPPPPSQWHRRAGHGWVRVPELR